MVWDLDLPALSRATAAGGLLFATAGSSTASSAGTEPIIAPRCVLYGHRDTIQSVALCTDLAVVASTAGRHVGASGCLLHNALTGVYMRSIAHPKLGRLRALQLAADAFAAPAAVPATESEPEPEAEARGTAAEPAAEPTEESELTGLGQEEVMRQLAGLRAEVSQRDSSVPFFGRVAITQHGQLVLHSPFDLSLCLFGATPPRTPSQHAWAF